MSPILGFLWSAFPQNSFSEWADYRFYGLRSAMAYVFVFDLTCYESFAHIKALRDQVMPRAGVYRTTSVSVHLSFDLKCAQVWFP